MDELNLVKSVKGKKRILGRRKIMGWGDERGYEKERLLHQWCPRQKQVEIMLQKSGWSRLTGKNTLLSRQNDRKEGLFFSVGRTEREANYCGGKLSAQRRRARS